MKQRGVFLIGLILITVYYFLFPRGSGKELVIVPDSLTSLESPEQSGIISSASVMVIRSGGKAGFLNNSHELFSLFSSNRMAVDNKWIAVSGENGLDLMEPDGRLIARIPDFSFPVSRNGNLYTYGSGAGILSKINPDNGRILWRREYISTVTVLDGRMGRTLVGLLDGRLELIDDSGEVLLRYRPGGSRVEAIYGGALSGDGTTIALISGLEPQRFILLDERKNGFRPVTHHNTDTDFRRYVSIGFIRNDKQVIYEGNRSVMTMNLSGYGVQSMELSGRLTGWTDNPETDTLLLLGRNNEDNLVRMLSRHDLTLFESYLPSETTEILRDRNYAIIVGGERIAALEFSVR